jgi:hypothetical protein
VLAGRLDPDDGDHAAAVLDPAGVAHLASAAGVERRAIESDTPRSGVDHSGIVLDEVRLFVAEIDGHDSKLPIPRRRRGR